MGKKIQKEKLDNIKKEEGEAKLDAEAEEKKKEDPKVAKKLANVPAEVVISAAQDVANKMLKKPENKTPEAGGDEPAQQAVMTQEQKMANEKEVVKTTDETLEQKRKETGRAELEVQHAQNIVNAVIEDNKAKAHARKHATGLQQDARDKMLAEAAEQAVIPSNVNA